VHRSTCHQKEKGEDQNVLNHRILNRAEKHISNFLEKKKSTESSRAKKDIIQEACFEVICFRDPLIQGS